MAPQDPVRAPSVGRTLGLGEALDASMGLARRHFKAIALVVLAISLPVAVLTALIEWWTTDVYDVAAAGFGIDDDSRIVATSDGAFAAGQVAIVILQALLFALVCSICVGFVADSHRGLAPGSVRSGLRALPGVISTALLMLALIAVSVVTIVGPIWLSVAWSVALVVAVVERLSGPAALRRSLELVRGRWWLTLGRLLVGGLIVVIGSMIVNQLLLLPFHDVDPRSFWAPLVVAGADVVAGAATLPFMVALVVVVYFDLRARAQGVVFSPPASSAGHATQPESVAAPGVGARDYPGLPPGQSFGGFAPPVPPSVTPD